MKNVIITGGAKGIGRCIAENFIKQKDRVFIIDKDQFAIDKMKENNSIMAYCGDIADKKDLENFVEEVLKMISSVDVIVNNACFSNGGLENCSYEDFNEVLRVGVSAPFYLVQLCMPYLSNNASIINISSTRAYMSQANTESYSAAKGAISALTHAMSVTLAHKARVNSISPGWIECGEYQWHDTKIEHSQEDDLQHPAARVGVPQDIANMVLYLAGHQSQFITGENINIDGGMTKLMIYHDDHGWQFHQ